MNQDVRVSVITVTFNAIGNGRRVFLEQNFRSVHRQTLEGVEHLVIDGGSTDGTVDLLRRYAKKGWIKYLSEPDEGIYDAMNKGLRMASGKYVAFLNSDDWWYNPVGLAESYAALERVQADFSFAPSYTTTAQGRPFQRVPTCIGSVLFKMPFCHQTMLTRRDRMLELGGFDIANFHNAADYDLILRLCLQGARFAYVPRNFTAYRDGGFSVKARAESLAESVKSLQMHYAMISPGFTQEAAARAFSDHILPTPVFEAALNAVSDDVREQVLAQRHRIENGSVSFDLGDYSNPVQVNDIDPLYPIPFMIRRHSLKVGGMPVLRVIDRTDARIIKLMGIPVFKRKRREIS